MNKEGKIGGIINGTVILKAAIIFLIFSSISILVFGALMYFLKLDYEYAPILGTISIAIGILLSSFFTAKKIGQKGFLTGLLISIIIFALVTIVSMILDEGSLTMNTLFHLIIYILSGLIGGISGVNKKQNTKYI